MTIGRALRPRDRLMVALDLRTVAEAEAMVRALGDSVGFYRIGLPLVFSGGIALAERLVDDGRKVFLDAKLLDSGAAIAKAVESIASLGVRLASVHADPMAMRAAVTARDHQPLGLLAIVLPTPDDLDVAAPDPGVPFERVVDCAKLAYAAGMDGIVAVPSHIAAIRAATGPVFVIVATDTTLEAEGNDAEAAITIAAAMATGADYVVVGRPILGADDPHRAAMAMAESIAAGLARRPHG